MMSASSGLPHPCNRDGNVVAGCLVWMSYLSSAKSNRRLAMSSGCTLSDLKLQKVLVSL